MANLHTWAKSPKELRLYFDNRQEMYVSGRVAERRQGLSHSYSFVTKRYEILITKKGKSDRVLARGTSREGYLVLPQQRVRVFARTRWLASEVEPSKLADVCFDLAPEPRKVSRHRARDAFAWNVPAQFL